MYPDVSSVSENPWLVRLGKFLVNTSETTNVSISPVSETPAVRPGKKKKFGALTLLGRPMLTEILCLGNPPAAGRGIFFRPFLIAQVANLSMLCGLPTKAVTQMYGDSFRQLKRADKWVMHCF